MAEHNVKINVKTDTGYDQLYPKSKSDIIDFDKSNSNLSSNNVEAAIKEVNTKANTNKTNIGTLASLKTDSKTNLVGAINEVDSHANTATTTANTNKTNIGTLSSLKTSVKNSIVNAINNLYDATIGKTLKTLDEINLTTEEGYYVDALAIKKLLPEKIDSSLYAFRDFYDIVTFETIKTGNLIYLNVELFFTGKDSGFLENNLYSVNVDTNTDESIYPDSFYSLNIVSSDAGYTHAVSGMAIISGKGKIEYSFPSKPQKYIFINGVYKVK